MKIALAQLNPTVGDLAGNAEKAVRAIGEAAARGASLVVLPELVVCGYPPRDLLGVEGFVERCAEAAERIGASCDPGPAVVVGTPLAGEGGATFNGVLVFRGGKRIAEYRKRLLPTYDVFDEDRYFVPGDGPGVVEVDGRRVGLAVCEDLWRGEDAGFAARYAGAPDPVGELGEAGVDLLVVPSASPFVLGKHGRHRSILAAHAARLGVPVVSVNQCGGNDDLLFDGRSCVIESGGGTLGEAADFEEDLLVVDLASARPGDAPVIPDERLVIDALTVGVRDYLGKCGFRAACLGISGGIDSALVAAIAVRALGPGAVTGVAMPGPYSSEGSVIDAYALAENLGMPCVTMPIGPAFEGHRSVLDAGFGELGLDAIGVRLPDLTQENLQSRVRGAVMMALSNRTGALLLTTGNKSELAVGYCTLYGDMNGGLAVISDVPKTMVFRVCRHLNEHHAELGFRVPPIPESTITKPPSAELAPGQLDSDSLPEYGVLDAIVERHVERLQSSDRIIEETGFDAGVVRRVCRLIDLNEYKRRQLAVGLKITHRAFGPGRRMPIAQRWVR
ncbi:MAG: NAD+ synthase [Planctomycetes bacterium]|nr:NAD+ synthase [Planctomycetota bacterium]